MKQKLFTLLLAVAASVGTMFAWDYERVQIGDLYYNLDATNQTAEVTYKSCTNYNYNEGWGITTANIPASVEYNSVAYSVTSIGDEAFYGCTSLTSVTIPNSVTSIGYMAFDGCSGLTSVTIPNSVTSIGERAFEDCTGLTFVTIPNSVTSIGDAAFYYCTGLTSVTIPNSVTSIGSNAFYNCTGLTSVTIPNSVTSIGSSAFCGCRALTSVTIGNSVTSIEDYAFAGCTGLTSVTIPNSVTSIGERAFWYCSGLTSIEIPNSVTSIGDYAFYDCTGLTSVTIGNSVTSIGSSAFSGCTGLTSVVWNAKNCSTSGGFGSQVKSFVFGSEVEKIPGSCCSGMSNLTSVTIPNSVTSIGGSAFNGCTGLTSVTIPNSVTSIGESAFYGCSGLTSVTAPAILFNDAFDIFRLEDSEMPSQIKQLTINGGELTEEGFDRIHASYRKLETIDLSAVENTEISDEAFKGCYNLKTLRLPAGLTQIGYMATAECVNLESIVIPASVEEIGDRAFEDCRSLQSITFGGANPAPGRFNAPAASASQLRRIGNWAFYNAHELQNLEIPEGVTEIGDGAFYGCTYLEEMVLPSSVQSIGDNCFALCAKLTKITCNAVTPPTIQAKTFYDVKRQIPVYVPDEAVSAYEGDTYWQEFDIQGQSEVPQGIDNTPFPSGEGRGEALKLLRDGQIFILRGDKIYNAQGALVK